ncbi:MAG: DUF2922 domain-containing protein [Synergistaceae bacterium]|jgi:hypothetical protein|nr:DUF2922 domain-containing protein [Synergistaceae bacterium]
MATSLSLQFNAAGDKKVSMNYPYADPASGSAQVKALMQSIVSNNAIFVEPPLALAAAEFVTRTVASVDLS